MDVEPNKPLENKQDINEKKITVKKPDVTEKTEKIAKSLEPLNTDKKWQGSTIPSTKERKIYLQNNEKQLIREFKEVFKGLTSDEQKCEELKNNCLEGQFAVFKKSNGNYEVVLRGRFPGKFTIKEISKFDDLCKEIKNIIHLRFTKIKLQEMYGENFLGITDEKIMIRNCKRIVKKEIL